MFTNYAFFLCTVTIYIYNYQLNLGRTETPQIPFFCNDEEKAYIEKIVWENLGDRDAMKNTICDRVGFNCTLQTIKCYNITRETFFDQIPDLPTLT